MEKITRTLLISVLLLFAVLLLTKGVTYAKYASNSVWNYYLESKEFYFSSDYLDLESVKNVDNNWDLNNIYFNIKNSYNDLLATEYDINYKVTCTTNNDKVSCNLNDTGKNVFSGVLSSSFKCVNEIDTVNVNDLDKTECELNGYEWKSMVSTKEIYFNLTSDVDYESVIVTIKVESTSPFKKTLLGTFELTKDKSINGVVGLSYYNFDNYDRLVVSNSYNIEKCARIGFDSSKLRIETPLTNVISYEKDENGYVNSIILNIEAQKNKTFKFYKLDDEVHTKDEFTIIESDC